MNNVRICFIGCGNMGRSLIGGILANGYPVELVCGADPVAEQRNKTRDAFDIEVYGDNHQALQHADIVVLAVKPQAMAATVNDIRSVLVENKPLIISIAAGIRLTAISSWVDENIPIIRAMPNTPALIQAGATALYANDIVTDEQRETAESIMRSVGTAIWVEHESLMDTVTALSGSGPAYFFLIMEALEKSAVEMGLQQDQARLLTLETALGAAKMAIESDQDTGTLRQQVTSPGGTTEQALAVLQEGNIEELFHRALQAAHQRSVKLADEFGNS